MSSQESAQLIPNGFYHLKFGPNIGVGGQYLTAGVPKSPVTIEALRNQPLGKTQLFHIAYDSQKQSYTIKSSAKHGVAYQKPANHARIITSPGAPSLFHIKLSPSVGPRKLYTIGIGGGSTLELVIGIAPPKIYPPLLELQPLTQGAVWQLFRVVKNSAGEMEQVEDDEDIDGDDELTDEELE